MITTTWAIEIVAVRITADVDEYGATIDRSLVREGVASHYIGGYQDEAGALAAYDAAGRVASMWRLEPTGDPQ